MPLVLELYMTVQRMSLEMKSCRPCVEEFGVNCKIYIKLDQKLEPPHLLHQTQC